MATRAANMEARDIVKRARTQLIIHRPFFGQVALMLEVVESEHFPTLATDGRRLYYNPEFVKALSPQRMEVAICHEILHAALAHSARFGNRDAGLWKIATDLAINPILKDCGFDVSWLLYEKRFHGLDADTIYYKIREEADKQRSSCGDQGQGAQGNQQGNGSSGNEEGGDGPNGFASASGNEACGGLCSGAGDEREARQLEQETKQMLARASTVAKLQGNLPGSLERLIDGLMKPKVNWREKLRHFMERAARNDYSWTRPNRRHFPRGFYLPTLHNMEMGTLVVAIDTSASIRDDELNSFLSELSAIMEQVAPECIHVVYCDAAVQKVDEYTADDLPLKASPAGGGGTDFRPPFRWVEDNGIDPQCLVYLTDMACNRYPDEPEYPVLWVSSVGRESAFGEPPFGELVSLTEET